MWCIAWGLRILGHCYLAASWKHSHCFLNVDKLVIILLLQFTLYALRQEQLLSLLCTATQILKRPRAHWNRSHYTYECAFKSSKHRSWRRWHCALISMHIVLSTLRPVSQSFWWGRQRPRCHALQVISPGSRLTVTPAGTVTGFLPIRESLHSITNTPLLLTWHCPAWSDCSQSMPESYTC